MTQPLIVGAGPTGLAAALFLHARGIVVRIIDKAEAPTATSKALGVNPRTLALLKDSGVTAAILSEGLPMTALEAHQDGRFLARIPLETGEFPMCILPQARTEALLTAALAERGIEIERGVEFIELSQSESGAKALVKQADHEFWIETPLLFAADGAHSAVRHALNIGFPGRGMDEDWRLMDVELTGPRPGHGYADFQREGPLVALPFDAKIWRLIGFGPPLLDRLPRGWKAGRVLWQSAFHVSHRVADRFDELLVCLGGDAAHIHSPIGARGMNLGIEDAFVFAWCAERFLSGERNALSDYGLSRRQVDGAVVKRIEGLTRAVAALGPGSRLLRPILLSLVAALPPLRRVITRAGTGLDHPLVLP